MALKVNPNSIVHVRDLQIGDGTPKIIIPLVGKTDAELTAQARRVRKEPGVDAVEWRVDFYEFTLPFPVSRLESVCTETPLNSAK